MSCSLLFGGDIAPIRDQSAGMFGDLTARFRDADLAVANLEIALTERSRPARGKIYPHKGPPASIEGLVEARFDALNLANNHMLDFGEDALLDTMETLEASGIRFFGAGRNLEQAAAPVIVERGGLVIGLLGLTTTLPTGFAATESEPGVNPFRVLTSYRQLRNPDEYPGTAPIVETAPVAADLDRLVAGVRRLKEEADVVLVYAHWGTSMTETVQNFQRAIGQAAIDAGAAAVLGGHQHVVSGIEFHHDRPIVHGLGNLVFDFAPPFFTEATRRTIVFGATITASGLEDCHVIPCRTGVKTPVVTLRPDRDVGREIAATLAGLSEPLGTALSIGGDVITVRPQ